MNQTWKIVIVIVITAVVVGGGVYYFQKSTIKIAQSIVETTKVTTPETVTTSAPHKSLVEYYKTREQFLNKGMLDNEEVYGFKQVSSVKIACPNIANDPYCVYDLLILSKDKLHSGNQEFYLSQVGKAGQLYYGPFSDNLQRIVDESKTIELLKEW